MKSLFVMSQLILPLIGGAATLTSNQENTSFAVRERGRAEWTAVGNGKFVDFKFSPKSFYEVRAKAQGYQDKVMSVQGNLDQVQFIFMIGDKVASVSSSAPRATGPRPIDSPPAGAALIPATKADTKSESSRPATPQTSSSSLPDAGKKIAAALAKEISNAPLKIGIDKFLYQGEESTPFSLLIRKQLSVSLQSTGKFTEVVRDKIASLQNEKKFQQNPEISSGEAAQLKVDGAVAILQGQFFSANGVVTIQASLVFLEGGKEITAQETVAESVTGARVGPKEAPAVPSAAKIDLKIRI
jgi:hypothetical protein